MMLAYNSQTDFGAADSCRPYPRSPPASSSRNVYRNQSNRLGSPARLKSPSTPTKIRIKTEEVPLELPAPKFTAMKAEPLEERRPLQDRNRPSSAAMLGSPRIENARSTASPSVSPRKRTGSPKINATKKSSSRTRSSIQSSAAAVTIKSEIRIPSRLPNPRIRIVSNPYDNLPAHLRLHGLYNEAFEFEDQDIPLEYILGGYISSGQLGKSRLWDQTADFIPRMRQDLEVQMKGSGGLPTCFRLDVRQDACGSALPPTHVLATYNSNSKTHLFAAHAMVVALQCTSIPFLPGCSPGELPVVPIVVPHPELFHITHKWMYSQETGSLFRDLIPMPLLALHLAKMDDKDTPHAVTTALSQIGTKRLLDSLSRIQAAWKNGAAIGILNSSYWDQLERGWRYVLNALILAKRRNAATIEQAIDRMRTSSLL